MCKVFLVPVGMERDGEGLHPTAQNICAIENVGVVPFWKFPFNVFRLWWTMDNQNSGRHTCRYGATAIMAGVPRPLPLVIPGVNVCQQGLAHRGHARNASCSIPVTVAVAQCQAAH